MRIFTTFNWACFTPYDIQAKYEIVFMPVLITSIRRSITDLTKEGRLIKCQWSRSRKGPHDTLNRTWRYNPDYIKPLNPKK